MSCSSVVIVVVDFSILLHWASHSTLRLPAVKDCSKWAFGSSLLEQPYHNALYYELQAQGASVAFNAPFEVCYRGRVVGEYFADLLVNGLVVKAVTALGTSHSVHLLNYLKLSGCRLGFLLNFQPERLEFRRLVV